MLAETPVVSALVTDISRYHPYNKTLVDRFTAMGFEASTVVAAFKYVEVDPNEGEDYELEEEEASDVMARLFHET